MSIFSKNITLGDIIQIGVIVVGLVVGYTKLEARISANETGLNEIKEAQRETSKLLIDLTKAIVKLNTVEELREKRILKD